MVFAQQHELGWDLVRRPALTITATEEGVVLIAGAVDSGMSNDGPLRIERLLPVLLPQLSDLELGDRQGDGSFLIRFAEFVRLQEFGIDAFEDLIRWSPFTIRLESTQWLGSDGFRYHYRLFAGTQQIAFERRGCFIRSQGVFFNLGLDAYSLLETIDHFNSQAPNERSDTSSLLTFSTIKGLAANLGAGLDRYLSSENVLIPSQVGVDVVAEPNERISFVPKIDSVGQDVLRAAFFGSDNIDEVYSLDDGSGGRVRVVFNDDQREVLKRIQKVRHVGGKERASIMREPQSVFDGVASTVDFAFGPRVLGIGDFPFVARPYLDSAGTGIFEDPTNARKMEKQKFDAGIECRYSDGRTERIRFNSKDDLVALKNKTETARLRGQQTVEIDGKTIVVDEEFRGALNELIERSFPSPTERPPVGPPSGKYLLIYTNQEQLEYNEQISDSSTAASTHQPSALVGTLKMPPACRPRMAAT